MLSEISQDVLEAAHDLNQRDAQIVDAKWDGTYEEQKENFLDDDTIWEQKGGVARKSTKHGGSYTAEGPYPVSMSLSLTDDNVIDDRCSAIAGSLQTLP